MVILVSSPFNWPVWPVQGGVGWVLENDFIVCASSGGDLIAASVSDTVFAGATQYSAWYVTLTYRTMATAFSSIPICEDYRNQFAFTRGGQLHAFTVLPRR